MPSADAMRRAEAMADCLHRMEPLKPTRHAVALEIATAIDDAVEAGAKAERELWMDATFAHCGCETNPAPGDDYEPYCSACYLRETVRQKREAHDR